MIPCCNKRVRSLAQASALALLLAAGHSAANPTGPTVTRGQATFSTQGNTLTVTNSPSAIINWQSFSIPLSNMTQFIQQSAASAVLNRVVASNPSAILGTLSSNGQVFVINPNGVVFGPNAQVNLPSLTISTSQISDASFLAGVISPPAPGSSIVTITAPSGTVNLSGAQQISLAGNWLSPPPSPGIGPNGNTAVNPGVTGTAIDTPPSMGSSGNTIVTTTGGTNATPIAVAVNSTMGVITGTFTPITANPPGTAAPYFAAATNNQPSTAGPGLTYNLITGVAAFGASTGIGSASNTIATTTGGTNSTSIGSAVNSGVTVTALNNPVSIGSTGGNIAITSGGSNATAIGSALNSGVTITAFSNPPSIGSAGNSVGTTRGTAIGNTASTSIATATVALGNASPAGSSPVPTRSAPVILQKREPLY